MLCTMFEDRQLGVVDKYVEQTTIIIAQHVSIYTDNNETTNWKRKKAYASFSLVIHILLFKGIY
jgi:hypothetical protein